MKYSTRLRSFVPRTSVPTHEYPSTVAPSCAGLGRLAGAPRIGRTYTPTTFTFFLGSGVRGRMAFGAFNLWHVMTDLKTANFQPFFTKAGGRPSETPPP